MLEHSILALHTVAGAGTDSQTLRDGLKGNFPPGSGRRMTLLGMMVGTALQALDRKEIETLVYSSAFGESLALEKYLESFPNPSPTLFQSSIHPSAVQQVLIQRQRPLRELLPVAGGPELVLQSALAALTNPAGEVVWCGGEECGTWLRDVGVAADRSFAFALALRRGVAPGALGTLRLDASAGHGELALGDWFELLRDRRSWRGAVGSGYNLELQWT